MAREARERDDDGGNGADHHASKVADLLHEAGSFPSREHALRFLLHSKDGAALLHRLRTTKMEKEPPMNDIEKLRAERAENLRSLFKSAGPVAVCKVIVEDGHAHGIGESELVAF